MALSDSADHPVYVETVTRTGYRFIAPVSAVEERVAAPTPLPTLEPGEETREEVSPLAPATRRGWMGYAAVGVVSAGGPGWGRGIQMRQPGRPEQISGK